jgi:transposase
MIRIDSIWLAIEPMDMCAGTDTALSRVMAVFGAAKPHCVLNQFANRRVNVNCKTRLSRSMVAMESAMR